MNRGFYLAASVCLSVWMSAVCYSSLAHADQVYTWTDENGVTHFSKTPPKERVEIMRAINTDIRNELIVSGEGELPEVESTFYCPAERLRTLRQDIKSLPHKYARRKEECDRLNRREELLGSLSECYRQQRMWHTEQKRNLKQALNFCFR